MHLNLLLQNFGLNEKQAEVYIELLQLGDANIQTIADETNLKRTTAYSVLDILIEKGLVYFSQEGNHRTYHAENPRKLPNLLAEENKKLLARQKTLIEAIPELTSLYNVKLSKPKIRIYEGSNGIKEIYNSMISIKTGSEILTFESAALMKHVLIDIWLKDHTKQRLNKKITQRVIVEECEFANEQQSKDLDENRQTLILPKGKFPFKNEISIFGNKVAIINFKELIGVIIESSDVAKTNHSMFELAWLGAQQMDILK